MDDFTGEVRLLVKNAAQMVTLFALTNLWMARRHLLMATGEVRLWLLRGARSSEEIGRYG